MAEDRLFRVIVLGGMALISAAPAAAAVSVAGCTPADAPGESTQVPQSQTVVVPEPPATPTGPAAVSATPPPPREGPPPPRNLVPVDAGASLPPVDAGAPPPPPPVDAGSDGGFHLRPPREGPPPRPKQGF